MKFSKAKLYTLIFSVLGLVATLLVFYVLRDILVTYDRNLPLIKLGDNVKFRTTRAHLWFEELLGGDKTANFEQQVLQPFTSSQKILQAAYDGQETEIGKFSRIDDEETKVILKEAIIGVESLGKAATALWKEQQNASLSNDSTASSVSVANSEHEQRFDSEFEKLQATLDRFIVRAGQNIDLETKKVVAFSWILVVVLLTGFSLLSLAIFRIQSKNDVKAIEDQQKLEGETRRVTKLSQFIEAVSAGNYDMELHAGEDGDNLTSTLITMRDKLKQNTEDDRKRNWSTTGLARIGEILRATSSTSAELYDNIIKFLVKYTRSNQGGLFIISDEDDGKRMLELVACYAFERKKFLTKKVALGDGLVGQCFLERERIYLTEVPQEYVSITSGLGGTNPNALLIVPMKVNENTYGVIELASFNQYEEYEIELVEKLAESIASTISNVRVNETTRILLEKTQQQAEEMKSQEEEIRQNMEELEATQEEMRRKQSVLERELDQSQQQAEALKFQEKKLTESQDTLQAIVDNIPRAIFWKDNDLRFMGCNIIFAKIAGANHPTELIGKTDFDMAWSAQADAYRKDDIDVMRSRKAKLDIEEVNINSDGDESWVRTSKVPIVNQRNEVVAILGMFEDITAWKRKEADVAQKLKELKELKEAFEARKI
jgi:PAS domain S-box-containing protein